ncbi:olfactory receptor 4E2-like [Ambystoma mexicanum]|uniref:olfactory receptor 4E2-like n=1 Tax=Ambystoma mexicanum TaxID=8296 RepID=UPI0037E8B587
MGNETRVKDFVLVGLSRTAELQIVMFLVFFLLYILTVVGNVLIIVTVNVASTLHSPMYFFLSNLSLIDLCYPTVTIPKMLVNIATRSETIPYEHCLSQLFFFHLFISAEVFLLSVMAFDRYVAICNPLRYTTIMNKRVCSLLVFASWLGGLVHSVVQTVLMVRLPFCGPNEVDSFFCDIPPLLNLACTDTFLTGVLIVSNSGLISLVSFILLLSSYTSILLTLRQHSSEGKQKALSTCASHLTVVTIFYGPCIFIYTRPSSTLSMDKIVSVFYAVITPLLNPIIYTLRNVEVKTSMKKLCDSRRTFTGRVNMPS